MINLEKLFKSGDHQGQEKEELCKAEKYPGNLLAELNKYCNAFLLWPMMS